MSERSNISQNKYVISFINKIQNDLKPKQIHKINTYKNIISSHVLKLCKSWKVMFSKSASTQNKPNVVIHLHLLLPSYLNKVLAACINKISSTLRRRHSSIQTQRSLKPYLSQQLDVHFMMWPNQLQLHFTLIILSQQKWSWRPSCCLALSSERWTYLLK